MNILTILKAATGTDIATSLTELFKTNNMRFSDSHHVELEVDNTIIKTSIHYTSDNELHINMDSGGIDCHYIINLATWNAHKLNRDIICKVTPTQSAYELTLNCAKQMLADNETFLELIDTPLTGDFSKEYVQLLNETTGHTKYILCKDGSWKLNSQQHFEVAVDVEGCKGSVTINSSTGYASIACRGRFASESGYHSHAGVNSSVNEQSIKSVLMTFANKDHAEMSVKQYVSKDDVELDTRIIDGVNTQFVSVRLPSTITDVLKDALRGAGLTINEDVKPRITRGVDKPFCYAMPNALNVKAVKKLLKPLMQKNTFLTEQTLLANELKVHNNVTNKTNKAQSSLFDRVKESPIIKKVAKKVTVKAKEKNQMAFDF